MSTDASELRRDMIVDAQVRDFVAAAGKPGFPREHADYTPEHARNERAIAQNMMVRAGQADSSASDGAENAAFQGAPVAPPARRSPAPEPPLVLLREGPTPADGVPVPTLTPWSAALAEKPRPLPPSNSPVMSSRNDTTVDLQLPLRKPKLVVGGLAALLCALVVGGVWNYTTGTPAPTQGAAVPTAREIRAVQTGAAALLTAKLPDRVVEREPPPPDVHVAPPSLASASPAPRAATSEPKAMNSPTTAAPKRPHEDFAMVQTAGPASGAPPKVSSATSPAPGAAPPASARPHLKNNFPLEEF